VSVRDTFGVEAEGEETDRRGERRARARVRWVRGQWSVKWTGSAEMRKGWCVRLRSMAAEAASVHVLKDADGGIEVWLKRDGGDGR
jgi:hypothetical protein